MKKLKYIIIIFMAVFLNSVNAQSENVDNKMHQIKIEVEGLSCSFCAYTLEKKLKTINGVEKLKIDFEEGIVFLIATDSKKISDKILNKTIEDSGFTPKRIIRNNLERKKD